MVNREIIRWIPAVFCMALIFYFSSQPYHQQDLRPKLHELLPEQQIAKHFSDVRFNYAGENVSIQRLGVPGFVEFFVRKMAHLSIYFFLGLSVALAFALRTKNKLRLLLYSVVFCALYASSDEFHQSLTGDRTPLITDVGIDTIGALFGVLLFGIMLTMKLKKNKN